MNRLLKTIRQEAPSLQIGGAVALLAAAALLFAVSDSSRLVASDVETAQHSEGVIGATALVNSSAREALIVAQAEANGMASPQMRLESVSALEQAMVLLQSRSELLAAAMSDRLPEHQTAVTDAVDDVSRSVAAVVAHLRSGDTEQAIVAAVNQLEPASQTLADTTSQIRDINQTHVSRVEQDLGQVATAARFMVAFVAPALVVWMIFRAMRRRHRSAHMRSELARERELHRKKNLFLAAASHQMKTPLSTVVGYAELLRDNSRDFSAGVRQEMIEIMAEQSRETAYVVDDILAAGRADFGELLLIEEEIEVRDLVETAVSSLRTSIHSSLTISGNARVVADRRWASQVVRNLLRNAASFGGEDVRVEISRANRTVAISVSDNGVGLGSASLNEPSFNGYYDSSAPDSGTPTLGLGLSVGRTLARRMGGDLTYTRLDGRSIFEFTLPVAIEEPDAPRRPKLSFDPKMKRPDASELRAILSNGGPEVVYQAVVDLYDHQQGVATAVGYEAKARFPHGELNEWLTVAESHRMLVDLEVNYVEKALCGVPTGLSGRFIGLNVSLATLTSSRLVAVMRPRDDLDVVFELSETSSIKSYQDSAWAVRSMQESGFRVAVDGVGAEPIDIWQLLRIGPALIKIDSSLVRDLDHFPENRAVIRAIASAAADLGIQVVCEGVDTEIEAATLLGMGIRFAQGRLFDVPVPSLSPTHASGLQ